MLDDGYWLPGALALYVAAAALAVRRAGRPTAAQLPTMILLGLALLVHAVAIGVRWARLGHGPYVDLFEILSSNVWSLHMAVLIGCLAVPAIRSALATALPLLLVLVAWLAITAPSDSEAPVTYDTVWLPVHVTLGKIFLGLTVVATALGLAIVARRVSRGAFAGLPGDVALDELAYRFILVAFVFETLMLIAGAIWAQDAWGRYWAWDPLETWAFVNWLAVIGYLHARVLWRPRPVAGATLVIGLFALAFLTFFGVPFLSTAPHKGAI